MEFSDTRKLTIITIEKNIKKYFASMSKQWAYSNVSAERECDCCKKWNNDIEPLKFHIEMYLHVIMKIQMKMKLCQNWDIRSFKW